MKILVDDSIELWLLKLRLNISDRLKLTGLIPDVRDIVLEYAHPCYIDETYLNAYSRIFTDVLEINGIENKLIIRVYSNNYSDYGGCATFGCDIIYPHMEVDWRVEENGLTISPSVNSHIPFSDIFRCFDMSSDHINILVINMISKRSAYCDPLYADIKLYQQWDSRIKNVVYEFMNTIWYSDLEISSISKSSG